MMMMTKTTTTTTKTMTTATRAKEICLHPEYHFQIKEFMLQLLCRFFLDKLYFCKLVTSMPLN